MAAKKTSTALDLEKHVRDIASLRWGVTAQSEHIGGVNYDCILHLGEEEIVAIEVTCQNNADKLRKDINDRLGHLKKVYQNSITVLRCYFVMEQEPSPNMVEYGRTAGVRVMSIAQFRNELLDYAAYTSIRKAKPFGSAINPRTGNNDDVKYISVKYAGNNRVYSIEDMIDALEKGKKIVLLGEYGTGKSRCVHEIFKKMSSKSDKRYTFAINLRENWGLDRKTEILSRHFSDLGLSKMTDAVVRISQSSQCCLLLDGFDEIGIQSWSSDTAKVVKTRKASLKGVAELVSSATGGVLITGREQYFNSEKEMFQALGISHNQANVIVLHCPDEFTESEMREYLQKTNSKAIDSVPDWIPKRPMIYNVLINLEDDQLAALPTEASSYRDYWRILIEYICDREARIRNDIWDRDTIFSILKEAAHLLMRKGSDSARITLDELNMIFKQVTGTSADADASVILQRLPGLGRISSDNPDRVFTDVFLLNGLKASFFIDVIHDEKTELANEAWEILINDVGYSILCDDYIETPSLYTDYLKKIRNPRNNYLVGILVMLITDNEEEFDFRNTIVNNVEFSDERIPIQLKSYFTNLTFDSCIFHELDITECTSTSLYISDSQIQRLIGIGNIAGKPAWIDDKTTIDECQSNYNFSFLSKNSTLTAPQMVLLSIIKKVFFQAGRGRQESALKRGIGESERAYVQPIIDLMKRESVIEQRVIRKKTVIYPNRREQSRMFRIQSELTLSQDPIWLAASQMK